MLEFHGRRQWALILSQLVLLILIGSLHGQEKLSQLVVNGIGKRFPAISGLVTYDRWPRPLRESPGAMMTAAISSDVSAIATGCGHPNQPGELVLWDAATGRERWVRPYSRGIRSVVFSSDGKRLVTGGFDGMARIIEVSSGQLLKELTGHTDAINAVAISGDDRWLVTGSHDKTAILWNLADATKVRTFQGHTAPLLAVALNPRGTLIASAGRDNIVRIWNAETGDSLHAMVGHGDLVEMLAFSPKNSDLSSASWDGTIRVWDASSGMQRAMLQRNIRMTSVAYSPKGNELWCGGFDGQVAVWRPGDEKVLREFKVQNGATYAVGLSGDGTRLVTCGFEGTARLWQTDADGKLLQKFDRQLGLQNESQKIEQATWSPDEKSVATVHGDGILRLTRVTDGTGIGELRVEGDPIVLARFASEDGELFVATRSGDIYRWHPETKSDAKKIGSHGSSITAMAIVADGSKLISCAQGGSIQVRNLADGRELASLKADSAVTCAIPDPTGVWVVTGHSDGRVRWWDLEQSTEISSDIRLAHPVQAVAMASIGGTIAVAAHSSIELLSLTIDKKIVKVAGRKLLTVPDSLITHLVMANNGEQLLLGDSSGQLRVWSASGGGGARTLGRRHEGGVTALAIAPRSQTLITAGADRSAWLWHALSDLESIRPLASIPAHDKGVRYVALAKNRLITDGYDNHVRIWNLESGVEERDLGVPDTASASVLAPNGEHVAVGHWSKRIQIIELESGKRLDNIRGLPRGPYSIALSPAGDRMAAAYRELGAMVYDLKAIEADPVVTLPPDELPFTHVTFAPDGKSFVTCTGDFQRMDQPGKLRLHNATTGAVIQSFVGHTSEIKIANFDADGKRLISASGDKTVRIWDVASGQLRATLQHPIGTFAPIFVANSDLVMTGDYHGKVYLWDLTNPSAPVQVVPCHSDLVNRIALSDDLSVLVTGSRDGFTKFWRLSGQANQLRVVDATVP